MNREFRIVALLGAFILAGAVSAQQPSRGGRGPQAPAFVSPEVQSDREVTMRIYAPQAQNVRLVAGDIPALAGAGRGAAPESGPPRGQMTKADIMPYAETHYRVLTDRSHRAIAGLSMGGRDAQHRIPEAREVRLYRRV